MLLLRSQGDATVLLHLLDTPHTAPQTMAFPVERAPLAELRAAVRAIVERADARPIQKLWAREQAGYFRLRQRVRFRVPTARLRTLRLATARALRQLKDPTDLAPLARWLEGRKGASVDVDPETWLAVATTVGSLVDLPDALASRDQAAAFIIGNRVRVLAEQLRALPTGPTDPARPIGPQGDIAWVRALRFRSPGSARPKATVVDPIHDVAVAPAEALDPNWPQSPADLLTRVALATSIGAVVELLVGPFTFSQGPGPFLPMPEAALPLEDPSWKHLPLFAVGQPGQPQHWAWPLCGLRVLEGEQLARAEQEVRKAKPGRQWHKAYNFAGIPAKVWGELVEAHWPWCRARFLALLTEAQEQDRAVVLLENELGHALSLDDASGERVVRGRG